ncbi:hypothetical protein VNO77_18347 [Canavalia gladiata]|uniref:Uncharacterized protein n=1 Tax=Canavalia gladiata TaxID=3824 RepID=A0AAN9QHK4_CANGL
MGIQSPQLILPSSLQDIRRPNRTFRGAATPSTSQDVARPTTLVPPDSSHHSLSTSTPNAWCSLPLELKFLLTPSPLILSSLWAHPSYLVKFAGSHVSIPLVKVCSCVSLVDASSGCFPWWPTYCWSRLPSLQELRVSYLQNV